MSSPDEDKLHSKRPKDTAFKQQRLPAWQPIMTASSVLPVFFVIGVIFIPLGVGLLVTSNNVRETIKDYTNCAPTDPLINNQYPSCADYLLHKPGAGDCECIVSVTLSQDYAKPVYIYYGLSNFYQNHRRYVKSRDDIQLKGSVSNPGSLDSNCEPFRLFNNSIGYAPCGAIANSLFNDSMSLSYTKDGKIQQVGLLNTGIAWDTDRDVKFNNPPNFASNGSGFDNFIPPPNWKVPVYQLDLNNANNNGFDNEDLIVWMRTAALPNFRKFYRRVDHSVTTFTDSLPAGTYNFTIKYNFPVTMFSGTKRVIISTTSWLGGKNPFLGVAYIVVGSICMLLGFVFVIIHVRIGKKQSAVMDPQQLNEHTSYYDQ